MNKLDLPNIFKYYKYAPLSFTVYIINNLCSKVLPIVRIYFLANFIDSINDIFNSEIRFFVLNFLPLVTLFFIENISSNLSEYIISKLRIQLSNNLHISILKKCAALDFEEIDNEEIWNLISRIKDKSCDSICQGFVNVINFVCILIEVISYLVIIIKYEWYLAFIIIFITVPAIIYSVKNGKKEYKSYKTVTKYRRLSSYWNSVNLDSEFKNERFTYKYNNFVHDVWNKYFNIFTKAEKDVTIHTLIDMKIVTITMVLSIFITAAILLLGVKNSIISSGIYIALIQAYISIVDLLGWDLSDCINEIVKFISFSKDFEQFFLLKEFNINNSGIDKINKIEIKNLYYKYPGNNSNVLNGINMTFEKNKKYAIVGINGSGKTTLVSIISGLYKNYKGTICINGIKKEDFFTDKSESQISVLSQEFGKYGISIKDNIIMGKNSIPNIDVKIESLLKQAKLYDVVKKLPSREETMLLKFDNNNFDFSGGQWQKLAMARMLLADSDVQILDEPTASLDPLSEKDLYEKYNSLNDKITIFISHRLGSITNVDKIFVLNEGLIIEQGTHEELMKKNGFYKSMYDSQKEWYK